MWERKMRLLLLIVLLLGTATAVSAGCEGGKITASGNATQHAAADVITVRFQIELQANTFADSKATGDALKERIEALKPDLPRDVTMSVSYDFGLLRQKRLAWSKGRKLEYEFIVTMKEIPPGKAQQAVIQLIDATTALDSRIAVEDVTTSLSEGVTTTLRESVLRAAVANARANAQAIADAGGLQILGLNSVFAAQGRLPDYSGVLTLTAGAAISESVMVRRKYAVDAGIREFEVKGGVVAEFCVASR